MKAFLYYGFKENKTRVESVQLGKTSKRLWSCQTLIFVLSIIFYKEKIQIRAFGKNYGREVSMDQPVMVII